MVDDVQQLHLSSSSSAAAAAAAMATITTIPPPPPNKAPTTILPSPPDHHPHLPDPQNVDAMMMMNVNLELRLGLSPPPRNAAVPRRSTTTLDLDSSSPPSMMLGRGASGRYGANHNNNNHNNVERIRKGGGDVPSSSAITTTTTSSDASAAEEEKEARMVNSGGSHQNHHQHIINPAAALLLVMQQQQQRGVKRFNSSSDDDDDEDTDTAAVRKKLQLLGTLISPSIANCPPNSCRIHEPHKNNTDASIASAPPPNAAAAQVLAPSILLLSPPTLATRDVVHASDLPNPDARTTQIRHDPMDISNEAPPPISSSSRGSNSNSNKLFVGWPPIRNFRRTSTIPSPTSVRTTAADIDDAAAGVSNNNCVGHPAPAAYVKVNMDGNPIGRKIDLSAYSSYQHLSAALQKMFHTNINTSAAAAGQNIVHFLESSSDFQLTYEDKDSDWMLVGDVPWEMFVRSVRRLKIIRRSASSN